MWAPPLLFVVAGLIGIVAALPTGSIGLPYLLAFAAAAIVGTLAIRRMAAMRRCSGSSRSSSLW